MYVVYGILEQSAVTREKMRKYMPIGGWVGKAERAPVY